MGAFDFAINTLNNALQNVSSSTNNFFNSIPRQLSPLENLSHEIAGNINNTYKNQSWNYTPPQLYSNNDPNAFNSYINEQLSTKPIHDELYENYNYQGYPAVQSLNDAIAMTKAASDQDKLDLITKLSTKLDENKMDNGVPVDSLGTYIMQNDSKNSLNEPSYFNAKGENYWNSPEVYYPGYPKITNKQLEQLKSSLPNLSQENRNLINDAYTNILLSNYINKTVNEAKDSRYNPRGDAKYLTDVHNKERKKYSERS